jgi:hypothetical protein
MKNLEIRIRIEFILAAIALLPLLLIGRAGAASTGVVAATITPQNISVSVTDGSVAYGTLALSSSQSTIASGTNDTQVATNDGNVAEDFNIRSTDATGGTTWTLNSTVGNNQFKHSFCVTGTGTPDPCDTGATWSAMTTSYAALANNVLAAGTNRFDLKLDTPTASTDYTQKSVTVTVQAVIH